jgi:hypothetical protein
MNRNTTEIDERQKSFLRPTHDVMNGFSGASGWNGAGRDAGRKVFAEILFEEATGRDSIWTSFHREESPVQPWVHAVRDERVVLSDLDLGNSLFWKP